MAIHPLGIKTVSRFGHGGRNVVGLDPEGSESWRFRGAWSGQIEGTRDPTRESTGGLFKRGRRVRGPNPDAALYETLDSFLPPVLLLTAARVIWRPVRL